MIKKILMVGLFMVSFFLWSPYIAPVLEDAGTAVASLPAVQDYKIQRDVRVYDYFDRDYQRVLAVTGYYYTSVTGVVSTSNSGFVSYQVSGATAREIRDSCSCGAYTDPVNRVVLVLLAGDKFLDESRLLSHERVHVLQINAGEFLFKERVKLEHEAEIVSRWTMDLLGDLSNDGKFDTRIMKRDELKRFKDSAMFRIGGK